LIFYENSAVRDDGFRYIYNRDCYNTALGFVKIAISQVRNYAEIVFLQPGGYAEIVIFQLYDYAEIVILQPWDYTEIVYLTVLL
jgi:hypothetical protein